jgi:hypothetical protein
MASFTANHTKTTSAVGHALVLKSDGGVKPLLYEIVLGTAITPADAAGDFRIIRTSTAGVTPIAVTEGQLDPDSAPPLVVADGGDFATDPTEAGGSLLGIPLNQRATFRWVTNTKPIMGVNAADNGLALDVVAQSTAFAPIVTMMWDE